MRWSAVLILVGCTAARLDRPVGRQVDLPDGGTAPFTAASAQPAPPACPADAPIMCKGGCCPQGSACLGGSCTVDQLSAACPSGDVRCGDPITSCQTGCAGRDASGLHNDSTFSSPAGYTPGRFGTGVTTGSSGVGCDTVRSSACRI